MNRKLAALIGVIMFFGAFAQYDISVEVNGLNCEDELLLANHFGKKQYLKDTAECENGVFHFRGDENLKSGVYLIVLPKKNYVEVLVSVNEDQMKYAFKIDTSLDVRKTETSGSLENELFLAFNKFAVEQSKQANKLSKEMEAEEDEDKKEKIKEKLIKLGNEVQERRAQVAAENPDLFVGKLYAAMAEVEIPEFSEETDEDERRTLEYMWIRDHYWDNVDMSEDGLVLSPVFHNKIQSYFDKYMPPIADTAIMMGDTLINRIERGGSSEQFKYSVHFLLGYFEKAKYMCFDKAVWHMAKNYYCAGRAFWSDSAYVAKMCEESAKMEPTLCDQIAPDMSMPDSSFQRRIVMSQIEKPVTVLVFWDINCGHCKKEMPIISRMYDSMTNKHFEIYAVYTQGDWKGWKERLKKEKFNFINVANAFGEDKFRKKYNIISTPQIYVLDQDKNIRFKKIGAKDIAGTVQYLLEEQGIVPKKEEDK